MTAIRKLPAMPTNKDLANSLQDLHMCLEDHIEETRASIAKHTEDTTQAIGLLAEEIEHISGNQVILNTALGIYKNGLNKKPKKPVALVGQWELIRNISAGGAIVIGLWKAIDALWPAIITLAIAVEHYIRIL